MKKRCPKCNSEDTVILSCGTILCHNPKCLRITPKEENEKREETN